MPKKTAKTISRNDPSKAAHYDPYLSLYEAADYTGYHWQTVRKEIVMRNLVASRRPGAKSSYKIRLSEPSDFSEHIPVSTYDPCLALVYTASEIARWTGFSPQTIRRWAFGASGHAPILRREVTNTEFLTFLDFVELKTIADMREHRVPLGEVRALYERVFSKLDARNPLAYKSQFFVFHQRLVEHCQAASGQTWATEMRSGQAIFEDILVTYGHRLDFDEHGRASLLYPSDHHRCVVFDPSIQAGAATVSGTRIDTASIFELYCAEGEVEEAIADVATWFELDEKHVRAAIEWEKTLQQTTRKAA